MKKQIKIYKIKGNPNNPRIIKDAKFLALVKSIKEFPEMLELRPIIVDENMMVLGGNMRWKAAKEIGIKEVWIDTAEGFTKEQKDQFVIKDNVTYGEWDWTMLANEWDSTELTDWNLDVWQNQDDVTNKVNAGDENSEWIGMPEFEGKEDTLKIIIHFDKEKDREEFNQKHKLEITTKLSKTWTTTYPFKERQDLKSLKYD